MAEFVGDLLQEIRSEAAQRPVQRGGFEAAGHHQVVEVAGNEGSIAENPAADLAGLGNQIRYPRRTPENEALVADARASIGARQKAELDPDGRELLERHKDALANFIRLIEFGERQS